MSDGIRAYAYMALDGHIVLSTICGAALGAMKQAIRYEEIQSAWVSPRYIPVNEIEAEFRAACKGQVVGVNISIDEPAQTDSGFVMTEWESPW